jgi:hypothetical protein
MGRLQVVEALMLSGQEPFRVTMSEDRARVCAREGFFIQLLPFSMSLLLVGVLSLLDARAGVLVFVAVAPLVAASIYFVNLQLLRRCSIQVVEGDFKIRNRISRCRGSASEIVNVGVGVGFGLRRAVCWSVFVGNKGKSDVLPTWALDDKSAKALMDLVSRDEDR